MSGDAGAAKISRTFQTSTMAKSVAAKTANVPLSDPLFVSCLYDCEMKFPACEAIAA